MTTEKQHVLSTYRRFFPVASGLACKFGLQGKFDIVMGNECNGNGGILVRARAAIVVADFAHVSTLVRYIKQWTIESIRLLRLSSY